MTAYMLKIQVKEDSESFVSLHHHMNISPYSIQQVNKIESIK